MQAGLVAGVLAASTALEDRDDLGDVLGREAAAAVELAEARAISRSRVLEGVDHRQRLLAPWDIGRLLARGDLRAPDAQQVVVELEGDPQGPAEGPIPGDDVLVVGREHRASLDRRRDERRRLSPD